MGGADADVRLWLLPAMRIAGGRGFVATTPRKPRLPRIGEMHWFGQVSVDRDVETVCLALLMESRPLLRSEADGLVPARNLVI